MSEDEKNFRGKAKDWLPTLPINEVLIVTPEMVNRRFVFLSRQVDVLEEALESADNEATRAEIDFELAMAKRRDFWAGEKSPNDKPYTVQEREDKALIENEELYRDKEIKDSVLRFTIAHVKALAKQVDTCQSIGTNTRSAMTTGNNY